MKKWLFLFVAVITMHATCAIASTITFNGADILAYSTSVNTNTTPVIGDGRIDFSDGTQSIGTYQRADTNISSSAFNTWVDGLGVDQGISEFNLWLQDGASDQAALWGETIALTDAYSTDITPFASSGWTASVYTVGTEWGSSWEGRNLITYTANSSADYLRLNSTATFGFTADIMGNDGATGPEYQMWVGTSSIVTDDTADYFQRAISANAVPEPATMLLFGIGLIGFAGVNRKKK